MKQLLEKTLGHCLLKINICITFDLKIPFFCVYILYNQQEQLPMYIQWVVCIRILRAAILAKKKKKKRLETTQMSIIWRMDK